MITVSLPALAPDPQTPVLLHSPALQAKKLEDIRSEAQAELGILDMPIEGLAPLPLPGALPLLAVKRPEEVELFPGGCPPGFLACLPAGGRC